MALIGNKYSPDLVALRERPLAQGTGPTERLGLKIPTAMSC
jgi:hypothetical protein